LTGRPFDWQKFPLPLEGEGQGEGEKMKEEHWLQNNVFSYFIVL